MTSGPDEIHRGGLTPSVLHIYLSGLNLAIKLSSTAALKYRRGISVSHVPDGVTVASRAEV